MIRLLISEIFRIFIFCIMLGLSSCTLTTTNKCKANIQNYEKVYIGMTKKSVLAIMGKPDTIFNNNQYFGYPHNLDDFVYCNDALASDDLHIIFDNDTVMKKYSCN
jgi:outer membrane protein assembly factor BamE (lipoprotein component of BamABCDE complex)